MKRTVAFAFVLTLIAAPALAAEPVVHGRRRFRQHSLFVTLAD